MTGPAVTVDGLTELRRAIIETRDKELGVAVKAANRAAAAIVVEAALPHVPYRSGNLLRTVKAAGSQTSGTARAGSPTRVPYAAAVHYGTGPRPGLRGPHNIGRRPFLLDALARTETRIVETYGRAVGEAVDEATRRLG